jgi:hypothetical protein
MGFVRASAASKTTRRMKNQVKNLISREAASWKCLVLGVDRGERRRAASKKWLTGCFSMLCGDEERLDAHNPASVLNEMHQRVAI